MPGNKYIKVLIDNQELDLNDEGFSSPISYQYEDEDNFQKKQSSQALGLVVPATVKNDSIANSLHNPGIEDLTEGEVFRRMRDAIIEANGMQVFAGKALLSSATHNSKPLSYEFNLYGNNADWILPLQEATIYDFLKHLKFIFDKSYVETSWSYNGIDESRPLVFAPVRYTKPVGGFQVVNENGQDVYKVVNDNMTLDYLRPSISVYWLLHWGFKSLGYRIQSDFFNTEYFRRLVMPWTWGPFLLSEGVRQDNLDFLAKSSQEGSLWHATYNGPFDVHVDNDATDGAFDNNNVYTWDAGQKAMKWVYSPQFTYGPIDATFHIQCQIDAVAASNPTTHTRLHVKWSKNGSQYQQDTILEINGKFLGKEEVHQMEERWSTVRVSPGDVISAVIWIDQKETNKGRVYTRCNVLAFEFISYNIPIGGSIDFSSYASLKKFKFLDFAAGILDTFNISPQTDPINQVVILEPQHDYSLVDNQANKSGGYYNGDWLNWDDKQDLSKNSVINLYSDNERELFFRFKDDSNDGLIKIIQQRNSTVVGQAKYLFPDRFKAGNKKMENRFFSPVAHADMPQWPSLGTNKVLSPQIVAIVSENVSNTSADEAETTFEPKLCYYKGVITDVGWRFDNQVYNNYPYMFAVNYQPGGENDPVLSYSDELINGKVGKGLLRRFYLQRMAIMRNGQFYKTFFRLNNNDVTNWYHREHIQCRGQKWELVNIKEYDPISEESTEVFMKKHSDIKQVDSDSVFPTNNSVKGEKNLANFDLKYFPGKALTADLPNQTQ